MKARTQRSKCAVPRPWRARRPWAWTLAATLAFPMGACDALWSTATDSKVEVESAGQEGAQGAPPKDGPEAIQAWMHLETREFPLLIWAAQLVQIDYHAPERFDVPVQMRSALDALAREIPDFFAEMGPQAPTTMELRIGDASRRYDLPKGLELREGAALLERVLAYVRDEKKLSGEALHAVEYAAINGYLAPLDPHTILLTPEEHADLGVKTQGRFGGVGIRVYAGQGRIVVEEVLRDSPAQKAGMKSGDIILKIDGQGTVNMPILEARELLRGLEGTQVRVQVRRGEDRLELVVTRGVIQIESVEPSRLPGNVAYLRISAFQQDTGQKVAEALAKMSEQAPLEGVLLDLRGNSGGLLTQATALLDHIVAAGELVIVRSAQGRETQSAQPEVILPAQVPVVALIDENSASAAEIVAGGVAALGRGVVIGRGSFGKGTVQMLKPSQPYGRELALKMTVAEYRVAGDTRIQGRGVRPDLELVPALLQEIPGVVSLYDEERFERARERSIVGSLPSARHEVDADPPSPPPVLRYLTRRWELEEGEPPPMRDAEVRLAHEIVRGLAGAGERKAALEGLLRLREELHAREDAAIAEGMATFWGDETRWATSESAQGGPLELDVRLLESGPVLAGEVFGVELTVKNPGSTALERVHVVSDCGQDELDGIEYVFGRLGPGETKRQTLNLVMMAWHTDLHDELRFEAHVGEPQPKPDARASIAFDLEGRPRPHLGFDVWIIDDPKATKLPPRPKGDPRFEREPFVIEGNGDGRMQPGEKVLFAFDVRNDGEGPAPDVFTRVRNLSGKLALLEEGEVSLGEIGPGKRARGAIGVSVRPDADPSEVLAFNVLVGDQLFRERVDDELRIPLQAEVKGQAPWAEPPEGPDAAPARIGPNVTFVSAPTVDTDGELEVEVLAEHPREVQDLVIWVQGPGGRLSDRKVAYRRRASDSEPTKLRARQAVELEPGPNRVRVIARDADGVEGRADAWIFVPAAEKK